jgi:hypothetical protein
MLQAMWVDNGMLLILRTEVGIFSHHRPEGYMSGA